MQYYSFKHTLNKATGNNTYFINGKRVSESRYSLMDIMCKQQDSFVSYTKGDYRYSFKSGRC
jgi:hypothetical protein